MHGKLRGEVAYILKGFPRLSETFIANEIHLLEKMGICLRLYSVKGGDTGKVHGVVSRIKASPTYLPSVTSLSQCNLPAWLYRNSPKFAVCHAGLFLRKPLAYAKTLARAIRMCWRYRTKPLGKPKKVFIKEFLQAGFIALRVLENGRIHHLHGHFCHGVATITWFVSQLTGLPFSFTAHAKDIYQSKLNPGDLLRRKLQSARFVVTCTEANRIHLNRVCPECEVVHTIYHGLDTGHFSPGPVGDVKGPEPLVLSVGRFVEKKGFLNLVQACFRLKQKGVRFQCQIVGERGDQFEKVQEKIRDLNLEDTVSLRDAVTQEELKTIYGQATVFALPCQVVSDGDRDGIPNVLVEAMAMGIPVTSTSVSGIPELIENGVNGLLVPERDSAAFAEAVQSLIENPDLRQRLSQAARERVCTSFDSTRTTGALRDLFLDSIQAVGAGS